MSESCCSNQIFLSLQRTNEPGSVSLGSCDLVSFKISFFFFFCVCFLFVSLLSCLLCVSSVRSPFLCVLLACWVSAQTSSVSLVSCFPISSCVFIVLSHPLVVSLSEFSARVSHPSSASASLFSVFAQFRL